MNHINRCSQLCSENCEKCFANNPKHIHCIADMVVNKACTSKQLIEMAIENDGKDKPDELLHLAVIAIDELCRWVYRLRDGHRMGNYRDMVKIK